MRKLKIGGAYGLLLSSSEYSDLVECVEAYCIGTSRPEPEVDPEIRAQYSGEVFTTPVPERFWSLHATLAVGKTATKEAPPREPTGN